MKLHLPKGLRSAVLACMAVVGGFATTVGTGVVTGGVLSIAFAGAQAEAALQDNLLPATYGGNFWVGSYTFAFRVPDLASVVDGTIVAAYSGSNPGDTYGANAYVLVKDGDTVKLKVGRGKLEGESFVFQENEILDLSLEGGKEYLVTTAGSNGKQVVTITPFEGAPVTGAGYNGNMNGGKNPPDSKLNDSYYLYQSWAATGSSAAWDTTSSNWTPDYSGTTTYTASKEGSVISFGSAAECKNVTLGGEVDAYMVHVDDGYTFTATKQDAKIDANTINLKGVTTFAGTDSSAAGEVVGNLVKATESSAVKIASGTWSFDSIHRFGGSITIDSGATLIVTADISAEEVAESAAGFIGRVFDFTTAGATTILESGVKLHTNGAAQTHTLGGTLIVNGNIELNGSNSRTWDVVTNAALSSTGDLLFKRNQTLKLSGGTVTSQGQLILGHESPGNYPGHLLVESGELTVDGIYLRKGGGNDTVTIRGGVIEFTPDSETVSVITRDNNASTVVMTGGTLKANQSSWVINLGSEGQDIHMGNVVFDISGGKSATLGGDIVLTDSLSHNSAGTLKFAEGTTITLMEDGYSGEDTTLTDYAGATSVGNGFEGGTMYVVKGTGAIEGTASAIFRGQTFTIDNDNRNIDFDTDYSLYFLNNGSALYSGITDKAAENGVTGGLSVQMAAGTTLTVDTGDVKGNFSVAEKVAFTTPTSIGVDTTLSGLSGSENNAVVTIEDGKTLTVTDGSAENVSFGLKKNSSMVFGDGTTGSITVKNVRLGGVDNGADNENNWSRNVTIKEGTTLNAANFSDNWGMGALRVDGVLNVSEQFKLWAGGAENDNNVVGNGVINTKNFESGNWGEYHLSVQEFNITGAATLGSTVKVTDGVLNLKGTTTFNGNLQVLANGTVNSSGVLTVNGGNMQLNGNLSGTVAVNGGTLDITKLNGLGAGTITVGGNGTLLTDILNQASGTTMTLSGKVNNFTKAGEGTIDISAAQLTGDVLMNYSGTLTGSVALANDATLVYGGTGKLMSITSLDTSLTGLNIDISRVTESDLADSIDLGISKNVITESFTLENLKSLLGIKVGSLSLDNVTNTVHYSATISDGAKALWDINWGSGVLVSAPGTVTEAVITDFKSDGKGLAEVGNLVNNRVAVKLVANNITDVSDTAGNVDYPLAAVGGAYDAPGNNGSELTIEDGVWINAVAGRYGAVVGGNMAGNWGNVTAPSIINTDSHIVIKKDASATDFLIRDVVGGNFGDSSKQEDAMTVQFNGNTYVSVYTDSVGVAVVGGSVTFHKGYTALTGDTNVFVYTALAADDTPYRNELKAVVGGMMAGDQLDNNRQTLTGNSSVTVDLSTDSTSTAFAKILVGGNVSRNGQSTLTGHAALTIKGNKAGNTAATFNQAVVGGNYAQGGTSTIGSSSLSIDGGSFSAVVVGGVYQANASTSTIGDVEATISNASLTQWLAGGTMTVQNSSRVFQGDVTLALTDSSFAEVSVGGAFIGGPRTTSTMGDVNVTLDGVSFAKGFYGGVYHYADSGASTSTVGDVKIALTGDGTISGNIWAAGGSRYADANITVKSTTVSVAGTVAFGDGVTVSGGFGLVAGSTPNATVTGDRTLEFAGTQDRSGVSFKDFDVIKVTEAASTVTLGALNMTDAVTIGGAGTIKLGAAVTFGGGATVDAALDLNGQTVTGDVTVNGKLTSGGGAIAGTLTLADGATISDVASATNIAVGTYSNTAGLSATESITVATKLSSSAALTATQITGKGAVTITGGKVTLSDTADAFANSGATTISGAKLAGTWTAAGVTIGSGTTVSGSSSITLRDSTINNTITSTSTGRVDLQGTIVLGSGVATDGSPSYSDGTNGFVTVDRLYNIVSGGTVTTTSDVVWSDGTNELSGTFANGTLTVLGAKGNVYMIRDGVVTYDGSSKFDGATQLLITGDGTGSLVLAKDVLSDAAFKIRSEHTSGSITINSGVKFDRSRLEVKHADGAIIKGEGALLLVGSGLYGGPKMGAADEWTGTVKVSGEVNGLNIGALGNSASTIELAGLTGSYINNASNTVVSKVVLSGDVVLDDGYTGLTQTFEGAVEGTGALKFTCAEDRTALTQTFNFSGDTSGWSGAITSDRSQLTTNIMFSGTSEVKNNISKTAGILNVTVTDTAMDTPGAVAVNGDVTATVLTLDGSGVTVNGDVSVDSMVVNQTATLAGSVTVGTALTNTGDLTVTGTLTDGIALTNSGTVSLSKDTVLGSLSGNGAITATDLTLTVTGAANGGAITAKALSLQGAANTAGDITLSGALTLGTESVASTLTAGALDITGGITFNALAESQITADSLAADLGLSISDALLLTQISQSATKSLTLMTVTDHGGHDILLNGGSEYDSADGQYRYTVDIVDGAVTITSKVNGLKWAGSDASNLWSEGDSWSAGVAPTDSDSVVFNGGGCSEVLLQGEVVAQSVTIDIGADIAPEDVESESYEFNGSPATDKLTIEKNLSVNAGELTLGVQTVVNGRTEVVAGAVLNVIAGNMDSRFGLINAGELNISTGQKPTAVSVAGGDLVNTGTIYNAGMLQAGYGVPGAENAPNIINSGSIENIGVVGVDGDLNNTGSYVQTAGSLVVLGDVNNTTDGENPGDMDISGGTVAVTGAINNSADLTVSGDETTVSVGSLVNTGGTLNIESGSVTVGSEETETPGTLDNSDGTIALGGESTTGSLIVNGDLGNTGGSISVAGGSDLTVNGDVDNKAGGSISVTGGSSLAVSGNLDNTGGDLSLSDSGTTAAIGGDLIMTDGTAKGTLTVGEGTELTVGGNLAASNVDLAFGGNVTVGGDVEIGTLNNNGIFTANGSEDTQVDIGTLTMTKNGTLSVGKETEDGLAGGHLVIGTLSGEGAVNVGKDGSLTINSATTFTGQLNNLGTLTITTTTLDSAQESEGQTAGDIITEGLTVTDNATGYNGGSYQLGNVQTDTLTIDGISPDTTRMSLSSLDSRTEGGKIKLVLSDIEDGTVTDGSYHLIDLDEAMAGSIAEEFDLSNYGYNADGDYDRTLATVQSDYMQALLKANKYVTFSDVAPTDAVALLSGGTTDVYASITVLSPELSVWNLNGTETMTEAGLTVLKDGKLVSDDILDNVQTVKVTGEQAIDLTGDITRVTLNNLTAAEGSATALTISGDGSADDSAAITTAADGFDGTLVLTKASADISGKVTTLQTGDDSAANLALSDSAIEVTGTGVTLSGVVNNGSLNFGLGSDELGKEIIGGDVRLNGTAINVTQQDNSIVIDGVGAGVNTIADLGETSGSATVTLNGKGFDKYFSNARLEGGNVVADRNQDYVTDKLAPTSTNGAAGAELLDGALVYDNPQASREEMPDRAALLDAVDAGRVTDEELAAVAGASVATMGMALSGDVERQLRAIRNRTTSMGVNECVVNEGMPYFNAWVNAEGNRAELDKDGTLAGYTLDSWGGTVGFDVDFDPHFTAGLAITAMYGDLTASGPETKAEGDMDTYYVTLFARYAKSAWTHTFVGTIGLMDGSLDRTVSAGGRTYKTEGDTEGMSFGLMYEVGYVMPLDEDATACLQPIFNVMLRHAGVDSYTEKGSDAALDVDSQSVTTLTFGLGARLQAVVGESLYNRASIFEARALVKADVGDRSSEADVAFVGSSHTATVESAELGAVGVELGAGLTIPVGDDDGSIFIDGSVELRSGYTNVNGTVGYRINF